MLQNDGEINEEDITLEIQLGWLNWKILMIVCDFEVPTQLKINCIYTSNYLMVVRLLDFKWTREKEEMSIIRWIRDDTEQDKIQNDWIWDYIGVCGTNQEKYDWKLIEVRRPMETQVRKKIGWFYPYKEVQGD